MLIQPSIFVIINLPKSFISGERLSDAETDEVLADCMDKEDDDGFIPYERKLKTKSESYGSPLILGLAEYC